MMINLYGHLIDQPDGDIVGTQLILETHNVAGPPG